MIRISYIYIASILIVIWAIYRIIVLMKSKEKNILREIAINIFFIYFLIVIYLTICKMDMLQINLQNRVYINYIPFVETIKMFQDNFMGIGNAIYNIMGNILLFVPLGFFIPLLFKNKNKIVNIVLYGFCASLAIEIIQLSTAINVTDIDDIIFNTLGAVLGFFTYNIFYYIIKETKLRELIRKVTSKFDGNLVALSIKPLGTMLGAVLIFIIITIYNSTQPANISNEDIAKAVFKYSSNTNFEALKDVSKYKLFLKDEGDYVNLITLERVLNNRWFDNRTSIGQYGKNNGDYSIGTIYDSIIEDNISMSIVVFGENKDASKVEINFNGKKYIEEIKPSEYFIVTFPSFEVIENSDMYNLYNGQESKILKIRFLDSNGNEYNEMKLAK